METPLDIAESDSTASRNEMGTFISWAYWALGTFCFVWEFKACMGVTRYYAKTELPVLGSCHTSEVLVFTLSLLWLPLLGLHIVSHAYQKISLRRDAWDSFPGVLGDKTIPKTLSLLRVLIFVALVIVPTAGQVFLTWRAMNQLSIVWKPGWAEGKGTLKGWQMLKPAVTPDRDMRWIFAPDWRWQHQYVEWNKVEGATTKLETDANTNKVVPSAEPKEEWKPVLLSAWPFLQPLCFLASAVGLSGSVFVLLFRGLRRERATTNRLSTVP